MLPLVLSALIGSGLGAGLGYFGRCSSGTCPLTSTWWRGAVYGAAMGLLFGFAALRSGSSAMNQSSQNVKRIGEGEFESEVIRAATPVLVDFYASWCGPCKAMAPVLEEVAGQFSTQVKFVKVNVDEAPTLAQRYEIMGVPTLLFFRNGQVVDSVSSMTSVHALRARLESFAGTSTAAGVPTVSQN